ncbi:MAG TPA: type II toxin-antitoxin system prevent-host-death family antitoxin [Acidobacteriaceae bacterium]|jgi:prevent-host-death family protein
MTEIQASEAKTRFLRLLTQVERGQSFVITRHGKPIARLTPEAEHRSAERQAEIDAAIAEIRELGRRNGPITVAEILSARDEGRK